MTSAFFTTDDGDVILRAGTEPDSKHDFRVHKFILSLASSVFKDMFAFPQPPNQTLHEQHELPIVDVADPPKVLDAILRFIYPGVESPTITKPQTLSALFLAADKYDIMSIYPALREILKTFTPIHPLRMYILACRFGFSEEAKRAAKLTTTGCFVRLEDYEDLQHISSTNLFRLMQFVQAREKQGQFLVGAMLDWEEDDDLEEGDDCDHCGQDARDYYFHLEKAVKDVFAYNPCVESKDLFAVLDRIPDPPPGCKPLPKSADWYSGGGDEDAFTCPLKPMTIRRMLANVAWGLSRHNDEMLRVHFGEGVEDS